MVSFTGSASTALKLRTHPDGHARIGPLRRRAGQPQRLAARARRRARHARVRPVHQGSRDRDDGQGGAEMHRDPPRHGAGPISRRGRAGARRAAGEDQGRRPARRGHAHGRAGQRQPARRRPRAHRRARGGRRAHRCRAIPTPSRRVAGGAFLPPVLLRTDDPWGTRRGPRLSSRSGRCRRSCPTRTWPTRSRSPIAARAAWCCRCSPIRPTRRASSSRARPPITDGCW